MVTFWSRRYFIAGILAQFHFGIDQISSISLHTREQVRVSIQIDLDAAGSKTLGGSSCLKI
ncbi:hypothetical protein BK146_05145 [Paenibacillus sp. FSL R7-0333]|nr:hypothetical protein BK146_05145 [Paenibacillus sp. FSL R7-0333]